MAEGGAGDIGNELDASSCVCGAGERRQRGEIHEDIKGGNKRDGDENGAWDGALGASDLTAEEAEVTLTDALKGAATPSQLAAFIFGIRAGRENQGANPNRLA